MSPDPQQVRTRQPGSRLATALRIASWAAVIVLLVILVRRVYPDISLEGEYRQAPDFELTDLDGQVFRLADHRGQVVVVNFWATWCPPCRAEIPGFVRLQEEFREAGVVFVGVALDEEGAEVVEPYARQREINYPIVLDRGTVAARFDGGRVLPTTFLLDSEGRIRYRHEGLLLAGALRPALADLVKERH